MKQIMWSQVTGISRPFLNCSLDVNIRYEFQKMHIARLDTTLGVPHMPTSHGI